MRIVMGTVHLHIVEMLLIMHELLRLYKKKKTLKLKNQRDITSEYLKKKKKMYVLLNNITE